MTATLYANAHPLVAGQAYSFEIGLLDSDGELVSSPTIASGDFTISVDGGAATTLDNLPTASGVVVTVVISAAETTGATRGCVYWKDAAGSEWVSSYAVFNIEMATTVSDGTGITLADDAITSAKFDETTAYPVKSADSGSTQIARVGADGDTLETLSDQLDGQDPADVWAYSTRTLTQSAAAAAAAASGSLHTIIIADSYSNTVTGLASNTGYTSIWYTVKEDLDDADSAAIIQIKKNASGTGDGLLYVNGAAAGDASKGSITVNSSTSLTFVLDESITDDLTATQGLFYSAKMLVSGDTTTITAGQCDVVQYATKAIT